LLIWVIQLIQLWGLKRNYIFSYILSLKKSTTFLIGNFNCLALGLGSWWAFQEGTWGGWWNWDSSEVFGLEFFLLILYIIHTSWRYFNSLNWIISISWQLCAVLLTYFFIQLNFDLVSHNFGVKFFFFFNNKLFFIISILILVIIIYQFICFFNQLWFLKITTIFQAFLHLNVKKVEIFWYLIFLYLFWYLVIFFTYYPLLGYFIYNITSWNIFNMTTSYTFLNYFFVLMLLYFIYQHQRFIIIYLLIGSLVSWNYWFLVLFSLSFSSLVKKFHSNFFYVKSILLLYVIFISIWNIRIETFY